MDLRSAIMNRLMGQGLIPGQGQGSIFGMKPGGMGPSPVGMSNLGPSQSGNIQDPRSSQGIFSRGSNVYNGGSSSARSGPSLPSQKIGRPKNKIPHYDAISRRIGG